MNGVWLLFFQQEVDTGTVQTHNLPGPYALAYDSLPDNITDRQVIPRTGPIVQMQVCNRSPAASHDDVIHFRSATDDTEVIVLPVPISLGYPLFHDSFCADDSFSQQSDGRFLRQTVYALRVVYVSVHSLQGGVGNPLGRLLPAADCQCLRHPNRSEVSESSLSARRATMLSVRRKNGESHQRGVTLRPPFCMRSFDLSLSVASNKDAGVFKKRTLPDNGRSPSIRSISR